MINIKIKMINNNKILIIIEITNDLNNNLFILSPPYLMYNGDDNHTFVVTLLSTFIIYNILHFVNSLHKSYFILFLTYS